MKFIVITFIFGFLFSSCAPSTNSNLINPQPPRVDEVSYNGLVDVKWCQPVVEQQEFVISWFFTKDGFAQWTNTKIENKQILQNRKVKWQMQDKVLTVRDIASNMLIAQKEIAITVDLNLAKKIMSWTTPSETQCSNGNCTTQSAERMFLSECE